MGGCAPLKRDLILGMAEGGSSRGGKRAQGLRSRVRVRVRVRAQSGEEKERESGSGEWLTAELS